MALVRDEPLFRRNRIQSRSYVAIRRHSCARRDALQGDHAKTLTRMPAFGYTMMCEQSAPDRLVADVVEQQFIAWAERELLPALRQL